MGYLVVQAKAKNTDIFSQQLHSLLSLQGEKKLQIPAETLFLLIPLLPDLFKSAVLSRPERLSLQRQNKVVKL